MLPFVRLGPLLLQVPGLALLVGIWFASELVEKEALRLRLNVAAILNLVIYALIAGLIGARLLYALEHLNAYLASPISLFAISGGALDGWGGLLVGLGVAFLYGRVRSWRCAPHWTPSLRGWPFSCSPSALPTCSAAMDTVCRWMLRGPSTCGGHTVIQPRSMRCCSPSAC